MAVSSRDSRSRSKTCRAAQASIEKKKIKKTRPGTVRCLNARNCNSAIKQLKVHESLWFTISTIHMGLELGTTRAKNRVNVATANRPLEVKDLIREGSSSLTRAQVDLQQFTPDDEVSWKREEKIKCYKKSSGTRFGEISTLWQMSLAIYECLIHLVFGNVLNHVMTKTSIWQIFIFVNGQKLKNNWAIWSHCCWQRQISFFNFLDGKFSAHRPAFIVRCVLLLLPLFPSCWRRQKLMKS